MTGIIEYVQSKAITGGGFAHFFEFFLYSTLCKKCSKYIREIG